MTDSSEAFEKIMDESEHNSDIFDDVRNRFCACANSFDEFLQTPASRTLYSNINIEYSKYIKYLESNEKLHSRQYEDAKLLMLQPSTLKMLMRRKDGLQNKLEAIENDNNRLKSLLKEKNLDEESEENPFQYLDTYKKKKIKVDPSELRRLKLLKSLEMKVDEFLDVTKLEAVSRKFSQEIRYLEDLLRKNFVENGLQKELEKTVAKQENAKKIIGEYRDSLTIRYSNLKKAAEVSNFIQRRICDVSF